MYKVKLEDTNNITKIYEEILDNKRKRFPINFWNIYGKSKARIVFKYLFEVKLCLPSNKLIQNLSTDIILKYKLGTPYKIFYNGSLGGVIKDIYPGLIKGKHIPMSEETKEKISNAQKNLSKEKRANITKGARENRYTKEYAKKLSDTKLGETNPKHKLIAKQVIEIKKLWVTGNYTTTILGDKFGVKRQTVADIVYGRTWKHLE